MVIRRTERTEMGEVAARGRSSARASRTPDARRPSGAGAARAAGGRGRRCAITTTGEAAANGDPPRGAEGPPEKPASTRLDQEARMDDAGARGSEPSHGAEDSTAAALTFSAGRPRSL